MTHYMNLASEPFDQIALGKKTIELRLYDKKRRMIKAGDLIEFTNLSDHRHLTVKVAALYIFDSFAELYKKLPLLKCGYTEQNIQYAKPEDMLEYYPLEKQNQYKSVGIEIELI